MPCISHDDNPVGSYIKEFILQENLQGKRLFLSFQGVETAFYVWLNGRFVGYGEDSFSPSEFEITGYVQPGVNKLAVEVYKRSSASWLEDQDFWRFSGIFRDVYLYAVPKAHINEEWCYVSERKAYCISRGEQARISYGKGQGHRQGGYASGYQADEAE